MTAIVCIGQKLQELGGFGNHKAHRKIYRDIERHLRVCQPEILYTGMALGVGQWAARICLDLNTPYIACLPYKNHELIWSGEYRQKYRRLLKRAAKIVHVDREPGYISSSVPPDVYHCGKMMRRNIWMIDQMEEEDILLTIGKAAATGAMTICEEHATSRMTRINRVHIYPNIYCTEVSTMLVPPKEED